MMILLSKSYSKAILPASLFALQIVSMAPSSSSLTLAVNTLKIWHTGNRGLVLTLFALP